MKLKNITKIYELSSNKQNIIFYIYLFFYYRSLGFFLKNIYRIIKNSFFIIISLLSFVYYLILCLLFNIMFTIVYRNLRKYSEDITDIFYLCQELQRWSSLSNHILQQSHLDGVLLVAKKN